MTRIAGGALCCVLLTCVALSGADDPDAIKVKLDKAKTAFEGDLAKFVKDVNDYFDKREAEARTIGNKKLGDQIKVERTEFTNSGTLPRTAPAALKQRLIAIRAAMTAAYELAVKDYTMGKQDNLAAAVDKELLEFSKDDVLPPYAGRSGAVKQRLLKQLGGTPETEEAVAAGLAWLAKQQAKNGSWEFDGSSKNDRTCATGMCLLAFLAAGETHNGNGKYKAAVAKGLTYLKAEMKPNGQWNQLMYSQAITTMALCEAYGMSADPALKATAAKAVDYIIKGQAKDGSWGYTAGTEGDTSIMGWQIQALSAARDAGLVVPEPVFTNAEKFLESVSEDGSAYGYRTKGATASLTAVGLLCRLRIGWTPKQPSLARGIGFMWNRTAPKEADWNMYYFFYAAQTVCLVGGKDWQENWNPAFQKVLLGKQIVDKKAADLGSWPKDNAHIGPTCGKLGMTAMAVLTLEVYYRNRPLPNR